MSRGRRGRGINGVSGKKELHPTRCNSSYCLVELRGANPWSLECHQEYLAFLKRVDASVPADLEVHLVVDNYATHKHPAVKRWLAACPRYHVHFTPTYASWLNQVEIWFNLITQRAIRRGTFKSVKELIARIEQFVQQYNTRCRPFVWTATAESILEKIKRLCQYISETQH